MWAVFQVFPEMVICGHYPFIRSCLKTPSVFALKAQQDDSQWQDRCKRAPPLVRTINDPRPEGTRGFCAPLQGALTSRFVYQTSYVWLPSFCRFAAEESF